ncbi:hypothetical protein DFH06DRAFT_1192640 [Mycena polygramma]|nr:hypothetical protein DFH06DRAFT_1192640 [Mycena polygramma]
MMCAAPNLEACTFLDITHQAGYRAAQYVEQTTHRSLKHLRFGEGSIMAPGSRSSIIILRHLTLPALESLLIIPGCFRQQDFVEFLTRSSPPLQSPVELSPGQYEGWNEADAAESVFRLIPSLMHLQLTFTNVLVNILSAKRAHAHPKMHSCRLIWDPATAKTQAYERRLRRDTSNREADAHIVTALQALVADGMEIHIGLDGGNLI